MSKIKEGDMVWVEPIPNNPGQTVGISRETWHRHSGRPYLVSQIMSDRHGYYAELESNDPGFSPASSIWAKGSGMVWPIEQLTPVCVGDHVQICEPPGGMDMIPAKTMIFGRRDWKEFWEMRLAGTIKALFSGDGIWVKGPFFKLMPRRGEYVYNFAAEWPACFIRRVEAEQQKPDHSCVPVNIGFTSIRMACKICGRDM